MPQVVGSVNLSNNGGFVCCGGIIYMDDNGNEVENPETFHKIALGQSEPINPGERGIADNQLFKIWIQITAGADRTGGQWFTYQAASTKVANYSITGTTGNSDVHFNGVTG